MGKWTPRFSTVQPHQPSLSGTWLVLCGGFLALALLWASLAYRFHSAEAPRALSLALGAAAFHFVATLAAIRRGMPAFVLGVVAVIVGIVAAVAVRVYFLVGVEVVAGVLLVLGRSVLFSGHGRG